MRQECDRLAQAIGAGGPLQSRRPPRGAPGAGRGPRAGAGRQGRAGPDDGSSQLGAAARGEARRLARTAAADVAEGRAALRSLLMGPIKFTPIREEPRRGYAFEAAIALDRLLARVIELATKMASASRQPTLYLERPVAA